MKHYTIAYQTTGILSNIIQDYIDECGCQQNFYKYPFSLNSFPDIIADKAKDNTNRRLLVDELKAQYALVNASEATLDNIDALLDENTFTITTAHQPNIFTGYLYFMNKVLGAVKTTEVLKVKYPEYNFIPVYWIGSEDHDFEEINHINLFGETLTWDAEGGGAVGRMDPKGLKAQIDVIAEKLGDMPFAAELIGILREAYEGHDTLGQATFYLVNKLFGKYGLVVLDQDRKAYKASFSHVIKDELQHQRVSSIINATIEELNDCNYKIQASPRELNLFYLWNDRRERIVFENDQYQVLNTDMIFSLNEILQEVDDRPERFSTNVFLRPVLQEYLLPNLAYVGGAGELAYWLELKAIFDHYKVNYPMLMLRNVSGIMDKNACKKMEKLGLSKEDLFIDEEQLIKDYVKEHTNQSLELTKEKEQLTAFYDTILEKAISVDATLKGAVEGQKQGQLNALNGLEAKILRAEKKNFDIAVNQIRSVKGKLFPNGKLMERVDNFIPFYAKYGTELFDIVKDAFDPFGKQFTLFFEE